jgi:plasmid stabilization system protein ParE
MPTYTVSEEAIDDLQNIWDFISADNEIAADRVLNELFEAFQQLAEMPGMGHTRRDLTRRDVRFWPLRSYLIVYRDRPLPLQIVAVLHGAQDVPSIIEE